jgi:hypothetical protein
MTVRPMAVQLPPEIRTELEQKLVENGFADYASLHTWLQAKGYTFGLSTVKRFGKQFEERCEMVRLATQQAEMMRQHFGDEEQALSEAALQMAQSTLFNLMLERGEELTPKEISLITRALSDTTRASVAVKKYQEQLRDRVESALRELEKENQGLSTSIDAHTLKRVREEIYGLF